MSRFAGATPERLQPPLHPCEQSALLHVGHSWGGGIDRWIHDYAAADRDNWNLLLRSRTWRNEAGVELELVDLAAQDEVLLAWRLEDPIPCTATTHRQYRRILAEIVASFGVEAVLASSLIGHSLDVLDTGLPTAVVLHDFVPFCPALFAWFGQPCVSCDRERLERCLAGNPQNVFWHLDDAGQWLALREAYAERLARASVRVAAPGHSVHERYAVLFPVLRDKPWREIPHGLGHVPELSQAEAAAGPLAQRRLRVVVPGRLLPHKGLHLFSAMLNELTGFADVLLLGSGDYGLPFQGVEHVEVVPDYPNESLGDHVRGFAPDCALLLSVIPETFSYILSEMFALGVPAVATRLGAVAERIEDGRNGFLVDPDPQAVLQSLRELSQAPEVLDRVSTVLRSQAVRTAEAMVSEYRELLGLDGVPAARRPSPGLLAHAAVREAAARRYLRAEVARRQQVADHLAARAQHLENVKALTEERADAQESRADAQQQRADAQEERADAQERRADAQEARGDAQEARANAQETRADAQEARADAQEARADAQEARANAQEARANAQEARANAQEARADAQQRRADAQQKRAAILENELATQRARAGHLELQLAAVEAWRETVLSSTSWRVTGPLRSVSGLLRRAAPAARDGAENPAVPAVPTRAGVVPPPASPTGTASTSFPAGAAAGTAADAPSAEAPEMVTRTTHGGMSKPPGEAPLSTTAEAGVGVASGTTSGAVAEVASAGPPEVRPDAPPDTSPALRSGASSETLSEGLPGQAPREVVGGSDAPDGGPTDPVVPETPNHAVIARPAAPTGQVRGAQSAESPEQTGPAPSVVVPSGDLLALARARRLDRVLGIAVDRIPEVVADQVPEGFSMLVSGPGPGGGPRSVACFEGLDTHPDAASTALAMRLDRVVVPAEGVARRFRELWPGARARVSLTRYPLAAQWPVAVDGQSLRARQRDRLGLPDRTRLVLGIGRVGSPGGLARFATLATRCCELRNDVRFVWMGVRNPDWERAHWLEVGLPVAMRRLFLVEDENLAAWLTAADAYIGCRSPDVHDPGAVEALAAGLPVCVASVASLPDVLRLPPGAGQVDEASGEEAIHWLAARVPALQPGVPYARPRFGADIAACLGGREVLETFRAACLKYD